MFGIRVGPGRLIICSGHILRVTFHYDGGVDSGLERAEIHRSRAATRVATASDATLIHFGTAQQIVESADGIPGLKLRSSRADEQSRPAKLFVFAGRTETGAVGSRHRILKPFALAGRVPGENDVTFAGEILEERLVTSVCFAIRRVAEWRDDPREKDQVRT